MGIKILVVAFKDDRDELNEPLGIECIKSSINETHLNNITSIDLEWCYTYKELDFQKVSNYDIIAFSLNIGDLNNFDNFYKSVYKKLNNNFLVVGGNIPTFAYEKLLCKYNDLICVVGEGEKAFSDLVGHFIDFNGLNIGKLYKINNLAYIEDYNIKFNKVETLNLSAQYLTRRDSKIMQIIKEKEGVVRIEGSRGCSWHRCAFCCVNSKYGNPMWRGYPVDKIVKELKILSDLGFKSPYFTDEDFFGQKFDRINHLAEAIIEEKNKAEINKDMNFFVSIMASDLMNDKAITALRRFKEAGLREVFLGIESFSKTQMIRYGKSANVDINVKAINIVKELGLQLDTGFILFDPLMSFGELKLDVEYMKKIFLHTYDSRDIKRLRIQPKTKIENMTLKNEIGELDIDNLEYPYLFNDDYVQATYDLYNDWENKRKHEVWKLQGRSRGEVNSKIQVKNKKLLSSIRTIDFEMLTCVIEYVEGAIAAEKLKSASEELLVEKDKLLKEIQ